MRRVRGLRSSRGRCCGRKSTRRTRRPVPRERGLSSTASVSRPSRGPARGPLPDRGRYSSYPVRRVRTAFASLRRPRPVSAWHIGRTPAVVPTLWTHHRARALRLASSAASVRGGRAEVEAVRPERGVSREVGLRQGVRPHGTLWCCFGVGFRIVSRRASVVVAHRPVAGVSSCWGRDWLGVRFAPSRFRRFSVGRQSGEAPAERGGESNPTASSSEERSSGVRWRAWGHSRILATPQ